MIYFIFSVSLCSVFLLQGMEDMEAGSLLRDMEEREARVETYSLSIYKQHKEIISEERLFKRDQEDYKNYRRNMVALHSFFPPCSRLDKSSGYCLTGARNFDQITTKKEDLNALLNAYFNHSDKVISNEKLSATERDSYIAKRLNILTFFQQRVIKYCQKDRTCAQDMVLTCEGISGMGCAVGGAIACAKGSSVLLGVSSLVSGMAYLYLCLSMTMDTCDEWRAGKILIGRDKEITEIYNSLKECHKKHTTLYSTIGDNV